MSEILPKPGDGGQRRQPEASGVVALADRPTDRFANLYHDFPGNIIT
jgi:hypothetical protein